MTPKPTTVRLTARQKKRIAKIKQDYGPDQSKVITNAVDYWLDAFNKASPEERMAMILRPKAVS
jgi:hypothetical protein